MFERTTRNYRAVAVWSVLGLVFAMMIVAQFASSPGGSTGPIDPFWIFCMALFIVNAYFLYWSEGDTRSRLIMTAFFATWIVVGPMPLTVPFIRNGGYLDRIRVQQPDGLIRETWRVLTFPHSLPNHRN